jgi:hypothetical protein
MFPSCRFLKSFKNGMWTSVVIFKKIVASRWIELMPQNIHLNLSLEIFLRILKVSSVNPCFKINVSNFLFCFIDPIFLFCFQRIHFVRIMLIGIQSQICRFNSSSTNKEYPVLIDLSSNIWHLSKTSHHPKHHWTVQYICRWFVISTSSCEFVDIISVWC